MCLTVSCADEETVSEPPGETGEQGETPIGSQLVVYPRSPGPGDIVVFQAGLFPPDKVKDITLEIDFPGEISPAYRVGDSIYFIVGISFHVSPGEYNLSLLVSGPTLDLVGPLEVALEIVDVDFAYARFSMPATVTVGWCAVRQAEDLARINRAREHTEPYPLWHQPFIIPAEGRVSSSFGAIRVINEGAPRRHDGIDLAAPQGTPVVATNCGIVRLSASLQGGGNTVIIDHGLDLSSSYLHLHTIAVEEGQFVRRGELIGTVGATGYATGPHLHWEVNLRHRPVNPDRLLKGDLNFLPPAYVAQMRGEK